MIKYIGFVIKPDVIEDVFIISFDTDDTRKRRKAYTLRSIDILNSWMYYSYNSNTQRYIDNDFIMEVYDHEIFDN